MTYQDTLTPSEVLSREITATRTLLETVGRFFAQLGESMTLAAMARQRMETVRMLQAKSDVELARLDIKRADIVKIVFKDIYYL